MKKVRFEDYITVYKIPYEDRRNYEFIDKQRFKDRIKEFEKIFKKKIKLKLIKLCNH